MPSKNDAWGIEVGSNAIKAIRLVRSGDDLTVEDYEVLPFKKILTTPDLDVDEAVQVGLDQLMSKHDFKKSTVIASVPGHMAFARFAKLPPVEPKKVAEIVKFEAMQQIPFPLEQVEWDYQVFQEEDSPEVGVGIFAITKDRVMKFLSDYQQVELRIDALTLSPLGVYNALAYDLSLDENSDGYIFVDIGTSSTDVIIVEGNKIWLRTLPIGGNNFTEALVKAFKITFPKAEKLKRDAGTSKYARQIFQAMRPVFADLVQEIQRSLGYYQSLNRDAELGTLIGVGSTFRLPGLTKFLKQQLQLNVQRLDKFRRVQIDGKRESEFTSNALNLSTAYGLALQGLGLEKVSANILPSHIISERMWKSKQPVFAAAAAVLIASVGFSQFYLMQAKGQDPRGDSGNQNVKAAVTLANSKINELRDIQTEDPREKIVNFERLGDYRDTWPKMVEDLKIALQSINSQEALLQEKPDYKQITQIPREQRRRIYIESYEVEYWPTGESSTARSSTPRPGQAPAGGAARPRFRITMKAATPYGNRYHELTDRFMEALRQTAQLNRPYVLDVSKVSIKDLNRVTDTAVRPGPGSAPSRFQTRPNVRSAEDFDNEGTGGRFSIRQPRPQPMRPSTGQQSAFADLLPQAPDSYQRQAGDMTFTIEWEVELLEPAEARKREDPEYTPPPAQETETDDNTTAQHATEAAEDNL